MTRVAWALPCAVGAADGSRPPAAAGLARAAPGSRPAGSGERRGETAASSTAGLRCWRSAGLSPPGNVECLVLPGNVFVFVVTAWGGLVGWVFLLRVSFPFEYLFFILCIHALAFAYSGG